MYKKGGGWGWNIVNIVKNIVNLYAVTADGFIAGPGEETRQHVQGG